MKRRPRYWSGLSVVFVIAMMLLGAESFWAEEKGHVTRQTPAVQIGPGVEAGVADEARVPEGPSAGLRFHFRFQPWEKVFDWLADQTGLSLQVNAPPPGTLNYIDGRAYTPAEAIELINSVLLPKGYRLVRDDGILTLLCLEGDIPHEAEIGKPIIEVTPADPPRPHYGSVQLEALGLRAVHVKAARLDTSARVAGWKSVEDFSERLAVFQTVFWDPRDTVSLRQWIRDTSLVRGKTVLEIGTGSGLVSLCCLQAGASRVVATDVNRSAIENAAYNADLLGLGDRLDLRLVPLDDPGAYSVIAASERFDLIVSNPPWEDAQPSSIDGYAFYDKDFELLQSLFGGLKDHLKPGGKALLAYGCVAAIRNLRRLADQYGVAVRLLDDRDPDSLPHVFLPGMLLELTPR